MAGGFTTAIHIARDLIDHQYNPRLGYSYDLLPRRGRRGVTARPRRLRLRERLNVVTRELISQREVDDVVFVVHSQGSVIAYEFMRTGGAECEQLLNTEPHLVTFGSPAWASPSVSFQRVRHTAVRRRGAERPRLSPCTNAWFASTTTSAARSRANPGTRPASQFATS